MTFSPNLTGLLQPLVVTLTRRRRRESAGVLLDNWWVDQPERPCEPVLDLLHQRLDRIFKEEPAIDPDQAFRRVLASLDGTDG